MSFLKVAYPSLTFFASFPVALSFLFKRHKRERLLDRFGFWDLKLPSCMWFHAPSVGEVNGMIPLISCLKKQYKSLPTLATVTSLAGLSLVEEHVSAARLLPFDNPFWIRRALNSVFPKVFIFSETELWPCLIDFLYARRVPTYLVNARISDYSFAKYLRFKALLKPTLEKISYIAASSEKSAERFLALGAKKEKLEVVGNTKYEVTPVVKTREEALSCKKRFFQGNAPVLVLGSLRPGEEKVWFSVFGEFVKEGKELNIIVAPRHPEKFSYFEEKLREYGLAFSKWSELNDSSSLAPTGVTQSLSIVLLDTLGELQKAYSFADVSFVGGTIEDYGGHNPLEPAVYGSCVLLGPFIGNIEEVVYVLKEADAMVEVRGEYEVLSFFKEFFNDASKARKSGQRAKEVWERCQGACGKILEKIGCIEVYT